MRLREDGDGAFMTAQRSAISAADDIAAVTSWRSAARAAVLLIGRYTLPCPLVAGRTCMVTGTHGEYQRPQS